VVDGKIYVIGGWFHSIQGPIYATVEVYDPVTDTWMKGSDIPVTTAEFSASVVDGKIHVIGGRCCYRYIASLHPCIRHRVINFHSCIYWALN